jgi:hypothetical protein
MPGDALIACRVTSGTKERVRILAEREGITESMLVRQMLDVVLRTLRLEEPAAALAPAERVSRDARLYVRLEPEDWRLLRERSKGRGLAAATYVSLLISAHLRGAAPIPKDEYLALKQSILELTALGRNLNQIARALNAGGRSTPPGKGEVLAMIKIAEGLRDHFKALLVANQQSWGEGHAKTSH